MPKVVPWHVVHENGLDFQVQLKLKRRQVPQFYEAILLSKLLKYVKIDIFGLIWSSNVTKVKQALIAVKKCPQFKFWGNGITERDFSGDQIH